MKYNFETTDYGMKITLKGKFEENDFIEFHNSLIKFIAKELKPSINFPNGFKTITDVRNLEPFNGFGTAIFKDSQRFLLSVGLIKSAKIMEKKFQKLWASIISANTEMEKKEKYFENEKEAEKWLNENENENENEN